MILVDCYNCTKIDISELDWTVVRNENEMIDTGELSCFLTTYSAYGCISVGMLKKCINRDAFSFFIQLRID